MPASSDHCACPSGRCRVGSHLIGVRTETGLGYVSPPLPVTEEFIELVTAGRGAAEERFRFTEPCIERGCQQWTGNGCGLIDELIVALPAASGADLPLCGIRDRCRWFHQHGASACGVCPYVATDNRGRLAPLKFEVS